MAKDRILLRGNTSDSVGASVAMSTGWPNDVYVASKFAVQCDFTSTPTAASSLSLLGCLDSSLTADSRYMTLGARTVTAGELTSLSHRFEIEGKPAKGIKLHMGDYSGSASFVAKAVATR